jgi:hypothetical protein
MASPISKMELNKFGFIEIIFVIQNLPKLVMSWISKVHGNRLMPEIINIYGLKCFYHSKKPQTRYC